MKAWRRNVLSHMSSYHVNIIYCLRTNSKEEEEEKKNKSSQSELERTLMTRQRILQHDNGQNTLNKDTLIKKMPQSGKLKARDLLHNEDNDFIFNLLARKVYGTSVHCPGSYYLSNFCPFHFIYIFGFFF